MKIIFNDKHPAQLPEIVAYINYARSKGWEAVRLSEVSFHSEADVYWTFMGFEIKPKIKAKVYVQDYCSGSVGFGKKWKNLIKALFNFKPDVRIFLNSYVRSLFHFSDDVPFIYRDMGISDFFYETSSIERSGYICVANLSTQEELIKVLDSFRNNNKAITIVGPVETRVQNLFSNAEFNFLGKVKPEELSVLLKKHEFGIVLYKDIEPYTNQTSTRILEYCASGLKVISTPTDWINQFYANNSYYKLVGELDFEAIHRFEFSNPDVSKKTWEHEIHNSGIFDLLQSKFKAKE